MFFIAPHPGMEARAAGKPWRKAGFAGKARLGAGEGSNGA
jgi:hypothetical protein